MPTVHKRNVVSFRSFQQAELSFEWKEQKLRAGALQTFSLKVWKEK
jgi:hypothetical protein